MAARFSLYVIVLLSLFGCGHATPAADARRDAPTSRDRGAPELPVDSSTSDQRPDVRVCVVGTGRDATYPDDAVATPEGFSFLYRTWFDLGTAGHCALHHIDPMPDMSTRDAAYAAMVGVIVPGTHCSKWYVHPGDPAHSILLGSLTGLGWPQMPPPPCGLLPPAAAGAVRSWISAGAPNN